MLAVVLRGPQDLVVTTVRVPEPGPGMVLLPVQACGICGSDLRYWHGENPWAIHTLGYDKPNPPDMVLGHEIAGAWEGGSAALLSFRGCGLCPECRSGQEQLCAHMAHLGHGAGWESGQNPGGMAEFCPVWREHVYPLPEGVSAGEGTLLDGLGVAVHAVRRAQTAPGGDVLVLGAGPIGLSLLQVARALGAGRTWVADLHTVALDCARLLGADVAADLSGGDTAGLEAEIRAATGGRGVLTVYESTGDPAAQALGLRVLARGGCLTLMAGAAPGLDVTGGALAGERTVTTCSNNHVEDYQFGLDLLASGRVSVAPIITHRFPLAAAPAAFEVALNRHQHGALKVILEP
jgi:threonine dehydrogenase-like Zn-dependent dehydrogenase